MRTTLLISDREKPAIDKEMQDAPLPFVFAQAARGTLHTGFELAGFRMKMIICSRLGDVLRVSGKDFMEPEFKIHTNNGDVPVTLKGDLIYMKRVGNRFLWDFAEEYKDDSGKVLLGIEEKADFNLKTKVGIGMISYHGAITGTEAFVAKKDRFITPDPSRITQKKI